MGAEFVQLSLTPLVIGVLAAIACALPGNFLILRRQALIGDAISHVVLPGIVVAFLITGAISTWPMMLGAAGAAVLAVVLIEAIKRLGRIEPGAAMGVTFTSLFAAGVLLLEQSDTSNVHLDVEHALYGNLESLIWLSAEGWHSLLDRQALADLPPELGRMATVTLLIACADRPVLAPPQALHLRRGLRKHARDPDGRLELRSCGDGRDRSGGRFRRGRVDHRDRDVHLPAGRRTAHDEPLGGAGGVERGFRRDLGDPGLRACRLRAALVRRHGCRERCRHDRNSIGRDPGPCLSVRTTPLPHRDPTGTRAGIVEQAT
jgi:hypothetical protein